MSTKLELNLRNFDAILQHHADGACDYAWVMNQVMFDFESAVDKARLKLAKKLARETDAHWRAIQTATGAPMAACRQAVIDARQPPASKITREKVKTRDGHKCRCCGSRKNVEVDHAVPRSLRGGNNMKNLQTLCHRCNVLKGSRVEFYA
jgi:hypothetical protein